MMNGICAMRFCPTRHARCTIFARKLFQSVETLANKMQEWLGAAGENKLTDWDI